MYQLSTLIFKDLNTLCIKFFIKRLKNERNTIENMNHEQERLSKIVAVEQRNVERVEELNDIIDR